MLGHIHDVVEGVWLIFEERVLLEVVELSLQVFVSGKNLFENVNRQDVKNGVPSESVKDFPVFLHEESSVINYRASEQLL